LTILLLSKLVDLDSKKEYTVILSHNITQVQ
jgi:hypothetical protein